MPSQLYNLYTLPSRPLEIIFGNNLKKASEFHGKINEFNNQFKPREGTDFYPLEEFFKTNLGFNSTKEGIQNPFNLFRVINIMANAEKAAKDQPLNIKLYSPEYITNYVNVSKFVSSTILYYAIGISLYMNVLPTTMALAIVITYIPTVYTYIQSYKMNKVLEIAHTDSNQYISSVYLNENAKENEKEKLKENLKAANENHENKISKLKENNNKAIADLNKDFKVKTDLRVAEENAKIETLKEMYGTTISELTKKLDEHLRNLESYKKDINFRDQKIEKLKLKKIKLNKITGELRERLLNPSNLQLKTSEQLEEYYNNQINTILNEVIAEHENTEKNLTHSLNKLASEFKAIVVDERAKVAAKNDQLKERIKKIEDLRYNENHLSIPSPLRISSVRIPLTSDKHIDDLKKILEGDIKIKKGYTSEASYDEEEKSGNDNSTKVNLKRSNISKSNNSGSLSGTNSATTPNSHSLSGSPTHSQSSSGSATPSNKSEDEKTNDGTEVSRVKSAPQTPRSETHVERLERRTSQEILKETQIT